MIESALQPIRLMLASGRFGDARVAIEKELQSHPEEPMLLAHHAALHMEFGDFDDSEAALTEAAEHARRAQHKEAQAFAELWLGYLHNRQGQTEDAIRHFEASAKVQTPSADLCAALCQSYASCGELNGAKAWGARALKKRADEVQCPDEAKVAPKRPRDFDPTAKARNVLSFSLFGKERYYQDCAVTIARTARGMFPEFTPWFFCSDEIPRDVKVALSAAGAKVMTVGLNPQSKQHPFVGLLWRFLPFDDPNVDVVLVRDVDSQFSLRERAAVDTWLQSDVPFLTMRDHVHHTEPLMAGMWGGFTGLLPQLGPELAKFQPPGNSKFIDQLYLRLRVWPRIRDATLAVDSVYVLGRTVAYPKHANVPGALPVGTAWRREQIVGGGAD